MLSGSLRRDPEGVRMTEVQQAGRRRRQPATIGILRSHESILRRPIFRTKKEIAANESTTHASIVLPANDYLVVYLGNQVVGQHLTSGSFHLNRHVYY